MNNVVMQQIADMLESGYDPDDLLHELNLKPDIITRLQWTRCNVCRGIICIDLAEPQCTDCGHAGEVSE